MTSHSVLISLFTISIILSACGHEEPEKRPLDGNASRRPQVGVPSLFEGFKSRLNNRLLVAGVKCEGGEITRINGSAGICKRGQYLITFDDINTCEANGMCTDIGMYPIISELKLSRNTPSADYYKIGPVSVVSSSRERRIKGVEVRVEPDGSTTVVQKPVGITTP